MTVRLAAGFFIVVLMVILCFPEGSGLTYSGGNPVAFVFQFPDEVFRDALLVVVQVKNGGTVLGADVRSLTVYLCGIMNFKEKLCQRLLCCLRCIEHNLYSFRMTGGSGAHRFIGRIFCMPPHVADTG